MGLVNARAETVVPLVRVMVDRPLHRQAPANESPSRGVPHKFAKRDSTPRARDCRPSTAPASPTNAHQFDWDVQGSGASISHPCPPRPDLYHANTAPPASGGPDFAGDRVDSLLEFRRLPGGSLTINRQTNSYPNLTNSTINNTTADIHQTLASGADFLWTKVVHEARHTSAELPIAPVCYPQTRVDVLTRLDGWARGCSAPQVFWLHGPAGVGKSAVVQDFATQCSSRKAPVASFFFQRTHQSRGNWRGLFPTLAFQLAASFSSTPAVAQHIMTNQIVFGQNRELQCQQLFVGLIQALPISDTQHPVIVIDGFDEFGTPESQAEILKLMLESIRKENLPIRLLISSRTDPKIQLKIESAGNICYTEELPGDTEGVLRLLSHKLSDRLRPDPANSPPQRVLTPLPTKAQLQALADQSSGMYIYAECLLRHVEKGFDPRDCLKQAINGDPASTAGLDAIYTRNLAEIEHNPTFDLFMEILKAAAMGIHPEDIDELLDLRNKRTARRALGEMHAWLMIPPENLIGLRENTVVHHASFLDYLQLERRSGKFCIVTPRLDKSFINCAIRVLSESEFKPMREGDIFYLTLLDSLMQILVRQPEPEPPILEKLSSKAFLRSFTFPQEEDVDRLIGWLQAHLDVPGARALEDKMGKFRYIQKLEPCLWMGPARDPVKCAFDLNGWINSTPRYSPRTRPFAGSSKD
ncbi:hypothetical protein DFH09DRAFT_64074 [Mycena vulgaris]|nr:hypothetical protein DFH09DRAFT_64074 [Mycena vulgaris]